MIILELQIQFYCLCFKLGGEKILSETKVLIRKFSFSIFILPAGYVVRV
jgi:hypothetical protein